MNVVRTPHAIQIRLQGQIQISGKNPSSRIVSGTQISGDVGGMQKLRTMLRIHSPQADHPAILLARLCSFFFGCSAVAVSSIAPTLQF